MIFERGSGLKGQISIFVILGVVLVLGFVVFFTFKDDLNFFNSGKDSYKIKEFVEGCIDIETKNAMRAVGGAGGNLYLKPVLVADESTPELIFPKVDGVRDLGGVERGYLFYYDDFEGKFVSRVPSFNDPTDRNSIEAQVRRYLSSAIYSCINDFHDFDDLYLVVFDKSRANLEMKFEEDMISTSLVLPLEIRHKNENVTEYISNFAMKNENWLFVPYYLSRDIVEAEKEAGFVESKTLSMLLPYASKEGRELLPPIYPDMDVVYDPEPWNLLNTEKLVKQVVSSNLNKIRFVETDPVPNRVPKGLEDSSFAKAFVNIYTQPYLFPFSLVVLERKDIFLKYRNYDVDVNYESFYPFYFDVKPSFGGVLHFPKTQSFFGIIPMFLTEYSSSYEMTYPVSVRIKPKSKVENFEYSFFMESNVYRNEPLRDAEEAENFGKSRTSDLSGGSVICDPSQRVSAPIFLNISDPVEEGKRELGEPLLGVEGAMVSFECKGVETCSLGMTKVNGDYYMRNLTKLAVRVPVNCYPGKLTISKVGYKSLVFDNLNPTLDKAIYLNESVMSSKRNLKLKIGVAEPSDSLSNLGKVKSGESAFLLFENLDDEALTEVVEVTSENQNRLNVSLAVGRYMVRGFVFTNSPFEIPQETICVKEEVIGGGCDDEETIGPINLNSWIVGGVESSLEVKEVDLLRSERIVVIFREVPKPTSIRGLEEAANLIGKLNESGIRAPFFETYAE